MAKAKKAYDEKAIQTLDPLAHIRLRPGMYIGRLGDGGHALDGIYVMLKRSSTTQLMNSSWARVKKSSSVVMKTASQFEIMVVSLLARLLIALMDQHRR